MATMARAIFITASSWALVHGPTGDMVTAGVAIALRAQAADVTFLAGVAECAGVGRIEAEAAMQPCLGVVAVDMPQSLMAVAATRQSLAGAVDTQQSLAVVAHMPVAVDTLAAVAMQGAVAMQAAADTARSTNS